MVAPITPIPTITTRKRPREASKLAKLAAPSPSLSSCCLQSSAVAAAGGTAAVIVTTPQDVAVIDVRKEVSFCRKVGLPVLGVVENMAGLVTPLERITFTAAATTSAAAAGAGASVPDASGTAVTDVDVTQQVLALLAERFPGQRLSVRTEVFRAGGGADRMCADMGVELLGRVPLDPGLGAAADAGLSVVGPRVDEEEEEAPKAAGGGGAAAAACLPALMAIVDKLVEKTGENKAKAAG